MFNLPLISKNGAETRRLESKRVEKSHQSDVTKPIESHQRPDRDRRLRADRRHKKLRVKYERRTSGQRRHTLDVTV